MVQQYVSQLRRALDGGNGTRPRSSRAGAATSCGSPPTRSTRRASSGSSRDGAAREALALWRGPPLADVADEPFAAAEIRRLEELRLAALEQAIDADLADGRHRELVGRARGARRASIRCASACTRS